MLIFYADAVYFLRALQVRIILVERQQDAIKGASVIIKRETLAPAPLSMEEMMITRLAAITLTILFAAVSLIGPAQAGASASAPSKNTRSSQLAAQQNGHKTAKNDYGITEYSSSSARRH